MKHTFLALTMALALGTSAQAQIPKDVMQHYKAYRTAVAENDGPAALKQAKLAWETAEEQLGDSKTTGDLAQNYADVKSKDGTSKNQLKAMERALELSTFYGADAGETYLQRGVRMLELYAATRERGKGRLLAIDLVEFGENNGLDRSVLYAEVLVLQATSLVQSQNGEELVRITEKALDVFDKPSVDYPSTYPIFANLYNGIGHEYEGQVLKAALSYQKVMDSVDKQQYQTNPAAGQALGRWSDMREQLVATGEIEAARAAGLCDCWPYDVKRNESLQPVKRIKPRVPDNARRRPGYTIVQFDLNDKGRPVNAKKVVSWPPVIFDESSLNVIKKWEYSPRQEGETDADRTNLITTIRYNNERGDTNRTSRGR